MTLPRPSIPLKVQRDAALIQLGLDPATAELDHDPALGLRERTPEGTYLPDANDPRHLKWRDPIDHAVKTRGTKATTAGSDIHLIAKTKRLGRAQAQHRERIELVRCGDCRAERGKRKRQIHSRGFRRDVTKGFDGSVRARKEKRK